MAVFFCPARKYHQSREARRWCPYRASLCDRGRGRHYSSVVLLTRGLVSRDHPSRASCFISPQRHNALLVNSPDVPRRRNNNIVSQKSKATPQLSGYARIHQNPHPFATTCIAQVFTFYRAKRILNKMKLIAARLL